MELSDVRLCSSDFFMIKNNTYLIRFRFTFIIIFSILIGKGKSYMWNTFE